MLKTGRVFLMTLMVFLPTFIYSQFNNNTTSPFSRFGLGDLQPYSFGRTSAMGGTAFGSRNASHINIANPASLTSLDSLSFLFEFGMNGKFSGYRNSIGGLSTNDVNFRYFAMAFRISDRIGSALSLTPYSDMGYDVQVNQVINTAGTASYAYQGGGSLSRATWSLAIEPIKNISLGSNLYYYFGTLTRTSLVSFPEAQDAYSLQRYEQIRLRDFGLNFGLQIHLPINKTDGIAFGATLENKPKFTSFHSDITQKYLSSGTATSIDTISFLDEVKADLQMPLTYGLGFSFYRTNKLELNIDYFHQTWSKAIFFGNTDPILTDLNRYAFGMEYIPERYSIRSAFRRIAYRAGARYEKSYVLINDQPLKDFGISFGCGLPVYRSNSTINLSAELGTRGNKKINLVRENYFKFNLEVTLYDLWFIKRRFD